MERLATLDLQRKRGLLTNEEHEMYSREEIFKLRDADGSKWIFCPAHRVSENGSCKSMKYCTIKYGIACVRPND